MFSQDIVTFLCFWICRVLDARSMINIVHTNKTLYIHKKVRRSDKLRDNISIYLNIKKETLIT